MKPETKLKFIEAGLCYHCKEHRPVEPGKKTCRVCLEFVHKNSQKYSDTHRYKYKKEYSSVGKCWRCTAHSPVVPGMTLCESCVSKNRKYLRELAKRRENLKLCKSCGKNKPKEGCVSCPDCLKHHVKISRRHWDKIKNDVSKHKEHKEKRKKLRRIFKRKLFMEYGGAICRCCGNTELERLQIDHVNNDGAEERRKLFGVNYGISLLEYLSKNGFPDKERFQVLCAGCNWSKSLNKGKLEIKFDWSKARFMTEQELINGLGIYDYAQLDPPNPGA